jgi:spore germination cell wall hydrolase CwlJ-like protein
MPQQLRLTVCRGEVKKTARTPERSTPGQPAVPAGAARLALSSRNERNVPSRTMPRGRGRPAGLAVAAGRHASRTGHGSLAQYGAAALGGIMLILAFAAAGHYMGQNAVAHVAEPGAMVEQLTAPSTNILAKGSLLPEANTFQTISKSSLIAEVETGGGKVDMIAVQTVRIEPAAVNLAEDDEEPRSRLALAPPPEKVQQVIKLKRVAVARKPQDKQAQKAIAQRRAQLAEENCLARAVYFEARSESELGQLAVAKVILNRVKDPEYPNTICGVVYQGSGRRNSCQFSFACDGLPDDVKSASSWASAKRIAKKAIAGDAHVAAISTATNYHADYVKPKWAKSMKRLIKIGRHVFYEDS